LTAHNHKKWMHLDGLPDDGVYNIVQTPDGYIWLAADTGLVRFDGVPCPSSADIPGVPPA
jgi:ligand-binding sensor domain-containing protein